VFPLLLLNVAFAAPVDVTVCGKYDVEYQDALPLLGDDYFTDNAVDIPAWGAQLIATCTSCSPEVTVFDDHLPWNTPDACATFQMDTEETYRVKLRTLASVRGNDIKVMNTYSQKATYVYAAGGLSPSGTGTYTLTTNPNNHWNIMAAATFALRRHGGLATNAGEQFDIYAEDFQCSGNAGGCQQYVYNAAEGRFENRIFLQEENRDNKYVIGHEMGHAVLDAALGANATGDTSAAFNTGACPGGNGHSRDSVEFQSAALSEGFANFYAAISFNDTSDADCMYWSSTRVDWTQGQSFETHEIPCVGASSNGLPADSYLAFCNGASAPWPNRANEWDWTRAFWELNQEMGFHKVTELHDLADAPTWAQAGVLPWNCGLLCEDMPFARLWNAVHNHPATFGAAEVQAFEDITDYYGLQR